MIIIPNRYYFFYLSFFFFSLAQQKCKVEFSQFLPVPDNDFLIGDLIKVQGSLFKMDGRSFLVCAKNIRKRIKL